MHHISDDLLSALVDEPSYQITWTWDHIDGYYEKLWLEHWGTGSLRTGAAMLFMLLTRRLLSEYVPEVSAAIGEDWWPAGIPYNPLQRARDWRLNERAAEAAQWTALYGCAPSHSIQGRVTHALHWAKLKTNAYIEDELTRLKADRMKPL